MKPYALIRGPKRERLTNKEAAELDKIPLLKRFLTECKNCGKPSFDETCHKCQEVARLINELPEWEYPGQEEEIERLSQKLLNSRWRTSTG